MADHRDKHAGERRHQGHRNGHHEGGFQFGGYRQCGADAQHLQGDGVVAMSGPTSTRFTSFISLCSAIIQLSLTNPFSGTDQKPSSPIQKSKLCCTPLDVSVAPDKPSTAWRSPARAPLSPPSAPAYRCHPAPACRQTAGASSGFPPRRPAPAFRPDRSK